MPDRMGKMTYSFFAFISRMKYIRRWALMRNSSPENVQEHSHMTAVLAHALAVIRRDVFGGQADPGRAAAAALFHDATEIITGDMPTPVKYHNPEIKTAYRQVEGLARHKLISTLPAALRPEYQRVFSDADGELRDLVKAADTLSAYIKCQEELKAGNSEFRQACRQTREKLAAMQLTEVDYFLEHFSGAFELTLDELNFSID